MVSKSALARIYGTSTKQIRRWESRGIPLENVGDAIEYLIGSKCVAKSVLEKITNQAAQMQREIDALIGEQASAQLQPENTREKEDINYVMDTVTAYRCFVLGSARKGLRSKSQTQSILSLVGILQDTTRKIADIVGVELENG